jgi:flagellar biosynthetic protein FliP
MLRLLLLVTMLLCAGPVLGAAELELVTVEPGEDGSRTWSVTIQVLLLMTLLTLLPSILLMFTSFTRIVIVLAILRQALGTGTTPSNQILVGLALFMTLFIMAPVADEVYSAAAQPYMNEEISMQEAFESAREPVHEFMRNQVRESDLALFASLGGYDEGFETPADVPFTVLVPAFLTSELKTAFQIGFLVFIPFIIIDLAVASVLMSMGMIMLSPMLVSLPFKLMLFVLIDGWALIVGTLASSFYVGG